MDGPPVHSVGLIIATGRCSCFPAIGTKNLWRNPALNMDAFASQRNILSQDENTHLLHPCARSAWKCS